MGGSAGGGQPWWVWALVLLVALPLGAFLIWRVRNSGPTAFATALPLLTYERLQRWTQRLGLGPGLSQTPYEHANQVSAAFPQAQPYVTTITDTYVQYRFSGQAVPAEESMADAGLTRSWRQLEAIFRRAWLQRLRSRLFRRGKRKPAENLYRLE